MLNVTGRLAVRLRNLPDWEIDWSDSSPQRSRQSLGIEDILPTEEDALELKSRATRYMMNFLVTEFSDLAGLRQYVPARVSLHPVHKSELSSPHEGVVQKDEKYTSATIDILSQLATDADLCGESQVMQQS